MPHGADHTNRCFISDMLSDAGNISFDFRGLDAGDRGGENG